ncbi:ATP-dependent Clp protease proteolytic subunit [Flavobacterium alkalisoli]|uniref:ATP-dependent Clp protease proteolytic subunit n=2 Tax=Flavobacterium TaxID=237 RepID=A0A444WF46_9FLAO|nr:MULTISPECIES: ATP-dependent Clp protease proteolytic subunit [Flavobacterium]QEE50016.1 ATP-dependent Clp protease proteolytic subunit [Flavobacterium alkalisoli]RYJ44447.1 ATP-dependent Clp protease proteolytic subunit [Flavobacterium beibuense]
MDKKEFRNYAVKHHRINSLYVDKYISRAEAYASPKALTPYIMEERQLNITQLDVFSRLMMDRIIFLGEQVEERNANIIQAQLLFLQSLDAKKDIQLYVNSPGGSVYAGFGIYDTMQYITPDVATICTGVALSMGSVLLCAGAAGKRSALKHARVMIHQTSSGAQGTAADMDISIRQVLKIQEELYQIIAKHSGQEYETISKNAERDYWMTAEEAKAFGMIDEILER